MRPGERLRPRTVVPHVRLRAFQHTGCGGPRVDLLHAAGCRCTSAWTMQVTTSRSMLREGRCRRGQRALLTPMRPPGCLARLAWLQELGVPLLSPCFEQESLMIPLLVLVPIVVLLVIVVYFLLRRVPHP